MSIPNQFLLYVIILSILKKLDCIETFMQDASLGCPYVGAKEHYILDIDDADFSREVVTIAEGATPYPKKKNK